MMQLTLSIAPGLTQRHRTLRDVTQTSVINSKGGVAGIAPELDMSPSQLGRKLNGRPEDPHGTLDIEDFDKILGELAKQKDLSPIYWLIEKYLPSDEQRRAAAIDQVHALLPRMMELMAEISPTPNKRGGRK